MPPTEPVLVRMNSIKPIRQRIHVKGGDLTRVDPFEHETIARCLSLCIRPTQQRITRFQVAGIVVPGEGMFVIFIEQAQARGES